MVKAGDWFEVNGDFRQLIELQPGDLALIQAYDVSGQPIARWRMSIEQLETQTRIEAFEIGQRVEFPCTGFDYKSVEIISVSVVGTPIPQAILRCETRDGLEHIEAWHLHEMAQEEMIGRLKRITSGTSGCAHVWKKYIGFTDVFDYCDTCGIKK